MTQDPADIFLELTRKAVMAADVPSAVKPVLEALVASTAAVGAAYFQQKELAYFARAAEGEMPASESFQEIVVHGLPASLPLLTALDQSKQPVFIADTETAPDGAGFSGLGVASVAAAPVLDHHGSLLGAFLMHTFLRHEWTSTEKKFFQGIADVLASVASRLVAEEQASEAREGAIRALGLALELRDGETKGHTDRVTELAAKLGQAAGLEPRELERLRWGAYLHDIGKIGIPDQILRKPGPLDDHEWAEMRRHPVWGLDFGQSLGFLPGESLDVIYHHHERWDGKGYPLGISGDSIPLGARIFSLCDVWDALRSDRPYKRPWSVAEARAEIDSNAGTRFDPELTKLFLKHVVPSV